MRWATAAHMDTRHLLPHLKRWDMNFQLITSTAQPLTSLEVQLWTRTLSVDTVSY